MKQPAKEALSASKTEFETMKAIAKGYSTNRIFYSRSCVSYFARALVTFLNYFFE